MRSAALLLVCFTLAGCGTTSSARLRLISSEATQASWSFVIDDRARGAEVLIDGRFRGDGCTRAGSQIRCELRGLFPGGHTVDVRLPAADLRRTVLIGRPWPARPVFVAVRDADEAEAAGKAGADGVVVDAGAYDPAEVVDAAHKRGARAIVRGPAELVETASADGVLGGELPPEIRRRFPEARAFAVDEAASAALAAFVAGGDAATFGKAIERAGGLVTASGLVGDAAALLAPKGALMDKAALPLLDGRRRHASLREGGRVEEAKPDGPRYAVTWVAGGDNATLLINAGGEPWRAQPNLAGTPLDLLGGTLDGGAITIKPHDVALLVRLPAKDKTRY